MTGELYVVMVADRHADPEPYLFSIAEDAIAFARETTRDWPGLVEQDPPDEWLYLAEHQTESDAVWVVAKTVNDPGANYYDERVGEATS